MHHTEFAQIARQLADATDSGQAIPQVAEQAGLDLTDATLSSTRAFPFGRIAARAQSGSNSASPVEPKPNRWAYPTSSSEP